jgi:hypothetical protein
MPESPPHIAPQVRSLEELPKPTIEHRSRSQRRRACPQCDRGCYRDNEFTRRLHDLGSPRTGRPRDIELTYSQHRCERCKIYFSADVSDLAPPKSEYTHRVISLALRLVIEDGLPYQGASWRLWRDHLVFVPWATIQNWVEGAGEKKVRSAR